MKFFNTTRFPADLLRTSLGDDRMSASVLARVTFDLAHTYIAVSEDQPYIVSKVPWESPRGEFEHDQVFKRGGVDVFVWGHAVAPGGRPTTRSTLSVLVGEHFRRDVVVHGARAWVRAAFGGGFQMTAAQPFASVPLSLEYAYGGKSSWDGLEVPWPDNPAGMGFIMREEHVEGARLPLFEDPSQPITHWEDRPPTVGFGFCPITSGARMKAAVVLGEDGKVQEITPRMFNAAFPEMVVPGEVPHASTVHLLGFEPKGHIQFMLPREPLVAEIELGEKRVHRALEVDQIGVDIEQAKVFVTYRFPFRYRIVPEQQRRVTLSVAS